MPDRMSKEMPNRIPDRMSEDMQKLYLVPKPPYDSRITLFLGRAPPAVGWGRRTITNYRQCDVYNKIFAFRITVAVLPHLEGLQC